MIKIIRTSTIPESLYILLKGQLKFLSNYFNVIGISSKGPFLDEVSLREEIRVEGVDMKRNVNPLKDLISLFKLYIQLKKENPIIVHSITPKAGLLTMLAAKMAGVPIRMHTFTGLIFPSKKGWMQKLLIKTDQLLCLAATNIYPEGEGVKNDLLRFKITSRPLKVLANGNVNGIDAEYFSPESISALARKKLKKELGISESDFVYIFVGRLVGDKGINELINAFSQKKQDKDIKLLLVGQFESELDPLLEDTLVKIRNNPNIISVGFQKDVRPYFSISNVLIFPSYREGFPNVVMQAGAMGLPSIVTNINGCNEIIIEKINGVIIPAKNINAILEAMLLLYNDHEYYNSLRVNARSMIIKRYDQKIVWNALLHEYNILLEKKGYVL
ncbi:glycosyl transferase family 1 [Elizabethkingia sp. HvH-WGS333]|uniref:glycosyltransferase family 4 protein n=1 Tax=Elizabethkingia TaxID=308865 RepID=UPI0007415683|nr:MULTISPECIES: glycosyltransferase family 4 protein [Elizabethkingia]KUG13362.1 glycosyl transferase family 1 [Elizabethkingia miricola]MCL1655384.1 glycosyltransferase family 4 protein [Elizabethkingia miricola]MCP1252894.1 glycosyltransferase family 4 protein [Elizabethkingia sp. S0634]MDX8573091.1 glycosyltransferase family 4 protein [Elizabethkingia sp. HX QKY]OIK46412.1 glycosyl transferase family 1 [Elizabethkingia sp. HvH-WGS333]